MSVGSEKNMNTLTLDGVDVMGERLADEVLDVISRKPELTKISFLAHSVGGLVARYAIAKLYRHPNSTFDSKAEGTICGLEAVNFITVATPHLGSRGNKQVPLLFGFITIEKVASRVIHWIFRRTGRHLFLTDSAEGEPPLLQHIVGWRTSSIRRNTELPKWEESVCEKYPHIVHEEYSEEISDEKCQDLAADCDFDLLEVNIQLDDCNLGGALNRKNGDRAETRFMGKGQVCVYERRSGRHTAHYRPLPALRISLAMPLAMQPEAPD
uniref:DUF676 domain-containing protein n=1 Tax=Aegilops tauschii TaxID=37682 RepID=R7W8W1_AEGTA